MTYQLPHPANELWRRTRPDRFTLPHPEELSREFTFHATGAEVSGIHVLPLKEGLKFLSGRSTGIPSDRLSESGLSALIHAEARIGYVLIVESGLSPEKPVEISLSVPSGQYHAMRCVVLIGEGSRVVLSESLSGGENGQLLAASFLHLGSDSSLTFRRQWTPSGTAFSVAHNRLNSGASLKLTTFLETHQLFKYEETSTLAGDHADLDTLFIDVVRGRGHVDALLGADHTSPSCRSRIEGRGVVYERGYSLHHGLTSIPRTSPGSDTYFTSRHLLLSERSRADSIPKLMIDTDDVKAGHGATVGSVDEAALFYLQSRGLTRQQAEEFLVEGFLAPVLARGNYKGDSNVA